MTRTVVVTERCDGSIGVDAEASLATPCPQSIFAGTHQALNRIMGKLGWRSLPGGLVLCPECAAAGRAPLSHRAPRS